MHKHILLFAVIYLIIGAIISSIICSATAGIEIDLPEYEDVEWSYNNNLILKTPFSITNKGFYDIEDLNFRFVITNETGENIVQTNESVEVIKGGKTTLVNLEIEIEEEDVSRYIFNGDVFNISVEITSYYAFHLILFQAQYFHNLIWQPLIDYIELKPEEMSINRTRADMYLEMPYIVKTSSMLSGELNINIDIYKNKKIAGGSTTIILGGIYEGVVIMCIDEINLQSLYESSGPILIKITVVEFNVTDEISYYWGAPIKDLEITYTNNMVNLEFENEFIQTINLNINLLVLNENIVIDQINVDLTVAPGEKVEQEIPLTTNEGTSIYLMLTERTTGFVIEWGGEI